MHANLISIPLGPSPAAGTFAQINPCVASGSKLSVFPTWTIAINQQSLQLTENHKSRKHRQFVIYSDAKGTILGRHAAIAVRVTPSCIRADRIATARVRSPVVCPARRWWTASTCQPRCQSYWSLTFSTPFRAFKPASAPGMNGTDGEDQTCRCRVHGGSRDCCAPDREGEIPVSDTATFWPMVAR